MALSIYERLRNKEDHQKSMYFKSSAALLSSSHWPGMKFRMNLIAIKFLKR